MDGGSVDTPEIESLERIGFTKNGVKAKPKTSSMTAKRPPCIHRVLAETVSAIYGKTDSFCEDSSEASRLYTLISRSSRILSGKLICPIGSVVVNVFFSASISFRTSG